MALQKLLIIGRDPELQLAGQKCCAEIFSADDLDEAKGILGNIDFEAVVVENIFCPANVKTFIEAKSIGKKTVIIGTSGEYNSKTDYINTGASAYFTKNAALSNFTEVINSINKPDSNLSDGFFLDSFAESVSIVGKSSSARRALKMQKIVGQSRCNPVLIVGETGTGKESAAKAVHMIRHSDKPFVAVNCAALTANLLESELFGHVKGSFTGADREKTGLLALAGEGSLFLDEISEIPLELQAKLLRVLQEKTFRKVGGEKDIECKATIIASSNRNLKSEVEDKKFRSDLYYRLSICPILLDSLTSPRRKNDIVLLAEYFLKTSTIHPENSKRITGFTPPAIESLLSHDWPGNVRELKNVIERAILLETANKIGIDSIIFDPTEIGNQPEKPTNSPSEKLKDFSLDKAEKELIGRALSETNGQKTRAAGLLGITRATLYAKLKQYEINEQAPQKAEYATV